MRWLITGGAGFIGSHFARTAVTERWADEIVILDALTYAGNLQNLIPIHGQPGWRFVHGDIRKREDVETALNLPFNNRGVDDDHGVNTDGGVNPDSAAINTTTTTVDAIFHFAAESHVDRSILSAADFILTNVLGTQTLLDAARAHHIRRFIHISTDEVYGSLPLASPTTFTEFSPMNPTSPYAASKAAAEQLALAAHRTHALDVVVTRCGNTYGPYQHPEKFIPLFVTNALDGAELPLYGDGRYVRDWIHVDDHVRGVRLAYARGRPGGVYNLGGRCERESGVVAGEIVRLVGADPRSLRFVRDRLAHDRRYAVDVSLAERELGFEPGEGIEVRLPEVVEWYRRERKWWERIKAGAYRGYYEEMYGDRPQLHAP